jgi:hypothetical protein
MLLVTLAVLVVGRLAVFRLVENGTGVVATPFITGLFAIAGSVVLGKWMLVSWQAIAWGLIAKSTFVLVSLACGICGMFTHPYSAGTFVVLALVFGASTGWERLMCEVLVFIHHPLESIRRVKKK